MKDEEKRCENCIHNEEHLKAIQEGKQGSAICMLECNPSHICFRPKDLGKIKDEEMAEQFADNISGLELTCSLLSAKDKSHAYRLGRYDGFLAGLKAGRPQWHKADVPTNPINKEVLGCIKDYNSKKFCLVKWNGEWWYDTRTWNDKVKLIAWCEIPTFDKE